MQGVLVRPVVVIYRYVWVHSFHGEWLLGADFSAKVLSAW